MRNIAIKRIKKYKQERWQVLEYEKTTYSYNSPKPNISKPKPIKDFATMREAEEYAETLRQSSAYVVMQEIKPRQRSKHTGKS